MKTLNQDAKSLASEASPSGRIGMQKSFKESPMQLCTLCVEKNRNQCYHHKDTLTKFGNRKLCPEHLTYIKEVYANRAKNK